MSDSRFNYESERDYCKIMCSRIPAAIAHIEGGEKYPDIKGEIKFYMVPGGGIIVEARVSGLPVMRTGLKAFF